MTTLRKNGRGRRPTVSTIYDGRDLLGTIVERCKAFLAFGADRKRLGSFANLAEARIALRGAARAAG